MTQPVVGRWYWVRMSPGEEWFPAVHDPGCAGGWTNQDTWEDFTSEVAQWLPIDQPRRDRICANPVCRRTFLPNGRASYCSRACSQQYRSAKYYQGNRVAVLSRRQDRYVKSRK